MRIDVFFDVYPHPAKPYFESQLTEWQHQGHQLRLFSQSSIAGASSTFAITFLRTLRQRPIRLLLLILWRCLTNPTRCRRVFRSTDGLMQRIKVLATDAQLPRQPPDVHFVHNLATAVSFSYLKCACPRTKLAVYYHGGEIPGVRQIPWEESSRALQRADVVFSNTQASIAEAVSRGARADLTACIPVGFALERFKLPDSRDYIPNGCWRFVCLGRMAPEKGFDVALNAFAALRRKTIGFQATFIGAGPELENLKELTNRLQLQDVVRFLGHIDFEKLTPTLAGFDALVLPSRPVQGSTWFETQATVMQEAMLMGAIVVASDIGGVRESLPAALHPYLFTPGSEAELADRLASVMQLAREEVRGAGLAARRFVEKNYDIRTINRKLLEMVFPTEPLH